MAFSEDTLTQANVLLEFAHFHYAVEESDTSRWSASATEQTPIAATKIVKANRLMILGILDANDE